MDQQNPFTCTYDSGKLLIETFGRGNLTRYLEPNLSQRNNFQREKIFRQSHSRFKLAENNPKNTFTIRDKTMTPGVHKEQKAADRRVDKKNYDRFEDIDQISQKINGIIRSISISCQKRGMSSKKQLERCETAQKLHKLQAKYNNHLSEDKHKSIERKKDVFSYRQQPKGHRQPNWFGQSIPSNQNGQGKNQRIKESLHKQDRETQEGEDYDDINQRIQYINDKITKYEKKMAGYQEVYKTNKKTNEQYFKESAQLKELKPLQSNREINSSKTDVHKSTQNKLKSFKEEVNKKPEKIAKQNIHEQSKDPFSKKQSYFNHKYKELSTVRQRNNPTTKIPHSQRQEPKRQKPEDKNPKKILNKQQRSSFQKFEGELSYKSTFIKAFIKQIALDQDFRHAKHMFGGVEELFGQSGENGNKKWLKLQSHLQAEGLSFSINEVKQIFMPRDDEIDPFASVSHSHEELVHGIIFAYQACQRHWNENFYHNWSFRQLKQSKFTSENLDRGKKGYVSLEDLTFFINTEVDGFYRNRDLMLIYHRIASRHSGTEKKVKYKEVIDHLLTS